MAAYRHALFRERLFARRGRCGQSLFQSKLHSQSARRTRAESGEESQAHLPASFIRDVASTVYFRRHVSAVLRYVMKKPFSGAESIEKRIFKLTVSMIIFI